jgi:hypothetical protein
MLFLRNGFVTQFQCKTNFRYGYSFTRRNVSVTDKSFSDCGTDFEVKQNGKTVPFRFTFGTNNLEMIPKPLGTRSEKDNPHFEPCSQEPYKDIS